MQAAEDDSKGNKGHIAPYPLLRPLRLALSNPDYYGSSRSYGIQCALRDEVYIDTA